MKAPINENYKKMKITHEIVTHKTVTKCIIQYDSYFSGGAKCDFQIYAKKFDLIFFHA